jgi:chromosome segregation ATPase
MATLASLVVSIRANIGDVAKNINSVVTQRDTMSKGIAYQNNSVKTLENSMDAFAVAADAVTQANQQFTLGFIQNQQDVIDLENNFGNVVEAVKQKSDTLANSIGNQSKNMNGLKTALDQLDKLKQLDATMQKVAGTTNNLSAQIATAKKNIDLLATSIMQAKTNATTMHAVMAMQALPFALLAGAVMYFKKKHL